MCENYRIEGDIMIFAAVYVGDVMIFSNDNVWAAQTKAFLSGLRMKDPGAAGSCLGIQITRSDGTIALNQEAYVEAMLMKINITNCKPAKMPMTTG